jgi:hypothetical protein
MTPQERDEFEEQVRAEQLLQQQQAEQQQLQRANAAAARQVAASTPSVLPSVSAELAFFTSAPSLQDAAAALAPMNDALDVDIGDDDLPSLDDLGDL